MKRIEKMSKEEISKVLTDAFASCEKCPVYNKSCTGCCTNACCCGKLNMWLNEEIKVLSRWQTCKTDEDLIRLHTEWSSYSSVSFFDFLLEKIEVINDRT